MFTNDLLKQMLNSNTIIFERNKSSIFEIMVELMK